METVHGGATVTLSDTRETALSYSFLLNLYTIMHISEFCGLWKLSRLLMEYDVYDNNT